MRDSSARLSRPDLAALMSWCLAIALPGIAQEPDAAASAQAVIDRGASLVEQRACRACHELGQTGAMIGPNLDQVTLRRSENWLRRWLQDPPALKPGTLMPVYGWTDGELDTVIAYLETFRSAVPVDSILAEHGTGPKAGKALVDAYQCWACHAVSDQTGRPIYPDLGTLAERRTPEWEVDWLSDPQAVIPGTFMPTFGFSEAEIEAIVDYLYE